MITPIWSSLELNVINFYNLLIKHLSRYNNKCETSGQRLSLEPHLTVIIIKRLQKVYPLLQWILHWTEIELLHTWLTGPISRRQYNDKKYKKKSAFTLTSFARWDGNQLNVRRRSKTLTGTLTRLLVFLRGGNIAKKKSIHRSGSSKLTDLNENIVLISVGIKVKYEITTFWDCRREGKAKIVEGSCCGLWVSR